MNRSSIYLAWAWQGTGYSNSFLAVIVDGNWNGSMTLPVASKVRWYQWWSYESSAWCIFQQEIGREVLQNNDNILEANFTPAMRRKIKRQQRIAAFLANRVE